ncbi:unnamed protein product [Cylicocyclus nassatus]|uniref:G-protein coupled receptors family 1 profile domain-containing protein n=1 Tax=Cylicocyclus nassatus TaxID=53992 RepID=A0AA36H879_CYLNA|nr:unnamed protein product [Cylicocyclus nassatus]
MMNMTNLTDIVEEDWMDLCDDGSLLDQNAVRYPLILIYLIVFTICLLGNFFTIVVIVLHPTMRTGTNYFLANLALADLLVAAFCILQNMVHVVGFDHGNWPLGEAMCYMYVFMLHFIPCLSVGILVCVSIEKYLVFMHPFSKWTQQILRRRVRFMMTFATWILSIASNIPYAINTRLYRFGENAAACARTDTGYFSLHVWVTVSFFLWYMLPLTVLALMYANIGMMLWRSGSCVITVTRPSSDSQSSGHTGLTYQMSNGRAVVYKQDSLLQVPEDPQVEKRQRDLTESRRKVPYMPPALRYYDSATPAWVVRLLIVLVASFAILTLPHHARLLHTMWSTSPQCNNDWAILLQPLSYISLFLSSAINPILYAFLSKRFREAASDIFYCKKGLLSNLSRSRSRTRTIVSDLPEDSRALNPSGGFEHIY